MLTIEVELLHGTFRGSTEDLALTRAEDPGEWPPSPARLFSALVAADGTRDRCRGTDGRELRFLEAQPAPRVHADPAGEAPGSPVNERFVVVDKAIGPKDVDGWVQDYPFRTSNVARPGTRRAPRHGALAYVWPDARPDTDTLAALRYRAARIGYLGCADSPVRLRVHEDPPGGHMPADVWEPLPAGDGAPGSSPGPAGASYRGAGATSLPVPFDGLVDVLDDAYDRFREGTTVRRRWQGSREVAYRDPAVPADTYEAPGSLVWLRFDRAVPGRRVLAVTSTLRAAIFDRYQRDVLGGPGELPSVLTGHGFRGRGYEHVRWLALPHVGSRHARGTIHGAAVWLPEGTPDEVVAGVHTAASLLTELVEPDVLAVGVRPGGADRPYAARPGRWQRAATRFASAFPVVHERYVRPRPGLAEVAEWCGYAGLPAPVDVELHRGPALAGAVALHPREVFRPGDDRRPYSHMVLTFDRPVAGPVVLGRGRHFGLGLFAPLDDREATDG